ncbi:hypothetical protein A2U01_0039231, partial [Trifolium medium]|nr:hypothetical protein [Trifolium medium]
SKGQRSQTRGLNLLYMGRIDSDESSQTESSGAKSHWDTLKKRFTPKKR